MPTAGPFIYRCALPDSIDAPDGRTLRDAADAAGVTDPWLRHPDEVIFYASGDFAGCNRAAVRFARAVGAVDLVMTDGTGIIIGYLCP